MATVTDWEDLRFLLIGEFYDALRRGQIAAGFDLVDENVSSELRDPATLGEVAGRSDAAHVEAEDACNLAFEVAKHYGWDSEEDDGEWYGFCLKATPAEILAEGLIHALQKCKPLDVLKGERR